MHRFVLIIAFFICQVLSTLKSALTLDNVRDEILDTWLKFLQFLDGENFGTNIGPFLSQIIVTLLSTRDEM